MRYHKFGIRKGAHLHRVALRIVVVAVFTAAGICPALPQRSEASDQQMVFQLELPFQHPTRLPDEVLDALRANERNREAFKTCPERKKMKDIPPNWFVAANVNLSTDERPGVVVKARNQCLFGANIGPFWVFRQTSSGYILAIAEDALWMEVLSSTTNGHRDLRFTAATANVEITREYRFTNGRYTLSANRTKTTPF